MVEPELVAITAMILAPMAYLMLRPNRRVTIGVTIIPPPIPRIAPSVPARNPTKSMIAAVVIIRNAPFFKITLIILFS